jgi:hypothetical protein
MIFLQRAGTGHHHNAPVSNGFPRRQGQFDPYQRQGGCRAVASIFHRLQIVIDPPNASPHVSSVICSPSGLPGKRKSAEHRPASDVMRMSGTISAEHGHENDYSRHRRRGVVGISGIGASRGELAGNRRHLKTQRPGIAGGKVGGNGKKPQHDNARAGGIERQHPSPGRIEGIAVAGTGC